MLNREDWLIELVKRDLNKELVSHYTKLETAVFDIIPTNKIKFTTQEKNNDPHEYRKDLGTIIIRDEIDSEFTSKGESLLKDNLKVFSTSISSPQKRKPEHTSLTNCSFGNVMMWAHYGNNHKGIVLLFEKKDLEKKLREEYSRVFVEEVNYKDVSNTNYTIKHDSQKRLIDNIYDELEKDKGNRFFSKQNEWSCEKELRWVILNENKKGSEFLDYKNSLKAVILGDRTEKKYVDVVKKLLEGSNIDLFKLDWDQFFKKSFKLNKV
ncbi:MAG: DUF2971 domain-containing protein [Balneola sp.]|nr:DUF2971 domain-containing protein [Balneola sp.]